MPTAFFPVEPQGLGTGDIEALDSYLLRLAAEHGVSEYQFNRVLACWWNSAKTTGQAQLAGHVTYVTKIGCGRDIDTLVQALEHGTGFTGLSGMTLSAFRDVSGTHVGDIVRKIRQWCPACFREWERGEHPHYEKLIWRLKPVTRCIVHEIFLSDRCPSCGCFQARHEDTWPRCASCGSHLSGDPHSWKRALWSSDGESDLLELIEYCASHPGIVFDRDAPRKFLEVLRNIAPHASLGAYFHSRPDPSRTLITVLLRLAQETNQPLLNILLDPLSAAAVCPLFDGHARPEVRPKGARRTAAERSQIRKDLLSSLRLGGRSLSLKQICLKRGCSTGYVRHRHPELVRELTNHQRKYRVDIANAHQAKLDHFVLSADIFDRASTVGWHQVAHEIALKLEVPVRLVRKRLALLRDRHAGR